MPETTPKPRPKTRPKARIDELARAELAEIAALGLSRSFDPLQGPAGPTLELAGPGGAERLVNWSSNDYLGLAGDPRLVDALAAGARRWGVGAGASRLVTGDFACMAALERELAEFEGTEASLLFNSGIAANLGLLPTLAGEGDVIVSDALNHASIIDGCRLSRASTVVVPHRDVEALERALRAAAGARRRVVVTESVFSMDGDVAPLGPIAALCEAHDALLVVDEAHASGVLGPRGAGLVSALGLGPQVDARMATLSKAVGVVGAHVAGPASLCALLVNRARSLIFTTALPPAIVEAARVAVQLLSGPEGDARRARLHENVRALARGLGRLGLEVDAPAAIVPVLLGSPQRAVAASAELRRRGMLVKAIRPPTVPEGTSRLRIAVSAGHTLAQVEELVEGIAAVL